MKKIWIVAQKEFLDILRDRRTVITMIVVPLLLFPLIVYVTNTISTIQREKNAEKVLRVGIISPERAGEIVDRLALAPNIKLRKDLAGANPEQLIKDDSLNLVVEFPENFTTQLDSMRQAEVILYFREVEDDQARRRVMEPIEAYEKEVLSQRLALLKITEQTIKPIRFNEQNIAGQREVIGKLIGGFLPYIFVLFCFTGCVYPGIDLFAGEKERGTLETLLTLPIDRKQILIGKLIVVASSGILAALLSVTGLVASLGFTITLPKEVMDAVRGVASPLSILLILSMLIPLAVFFAGMLIPLVSRAKSFKEAASQLGPLNFVVIIPAVIGLMPGIELNLGTALIPILNVTLATKDIVAGTINYGLLALVFVSLISLAGLGIFLSVRSFSSESNIVKS